MHKKFSRNKEDFVCEHCNQAVTGNGYTNHCPNCLYSKHVDINPGDRAETCCGLMQPVEIHQKSGVYTLTHKCTKCGYTRPNKVSVNDNFDQVVTLSVRK